MVDAPDLLLDRTTTWRRRVPLWVLRLAVAVPLAALVVAEMATTDPCTVADPCRDPFQPAGYWLGAVVVAWALACVPLSVVWPRAVPWPAAVVAISEALVPASESPVRPVWGALAVAWAALGAADVLLRWRQRVLAQGWDGLHLTLPAPAGAVRRLPRDADARTGALAVLVLMSAVTVGLLSWHAHDLAGVREFEARAERVEARVVGTEDDGFTLRLDVAGRRARVDALESYRVGDVVPVLADPVRPGEVALVAEPRDPSWSLSLAAVALLVGSTVALRLWVRGAARARLVELGGRAVRVRVGRHGTGLVIGAVDDRYLEHPLGVVSDDVGLLRDVLDPEVPDDEDGAPDATEDATDATAERAAADDAEEVAHRSLPDAAGGEWSPASERALLAGLPDAELVAWAEGNLDLDDFWCDEDDDNEDEEDGAGWLPERVGFAADGGTVLTVVGLSCDGAPLALLDDEGEAWLTRPLRDPWRPGDLAGLAFGVGRGRPPAPADPVVADELGRARRRSAPSDREPEDPPARSAWRRATDRLAPVAGRYGLPLAYGLAVLAYPVARWLYGSHPSTWSLLHALWVLLGPAEGLVVLAGLGHAALVRHPAGVLHRAMLLERVLPARRVTSVLAGPTMLAFRLVDPEEAMAVPAVAVVPFRRARGAGAPSPEQSRELVLQWLRAARGPAPRWSRRPTAAAGPGVVLLVAVVAAWAVPRLAG